MGGVYVHMHRMGVCHADAGEGDEGVVKLHGTQTRVLNVMWWLGFWAVLVLRTKSV